MKAFWKMRVLSFYLCTTFVIVGFSVASVSVKKLGCQYGTIYGICKYFSNLFVQCAKYTCSLRYKVVGLEKLPNCPSVVLSNHQSFWENIFMQVIIPKHSWVVKEETKKIPLFGKAFIKSLDPITVDRKDVGSVVKIIKKGSEKIKKGLWVIIFPESTRVLPTQKSSIKPSGVKLAMENNVPIVVLLHNAGLYWPKGFWVKKSGTIKVKIVHVIYPKDFVNKTVREVNDQVEQIMNNVKMSL